MNEKNNDSVTLAYLFKCLRSKSKTIIALTLVAVIIGAALGAFIAPGKTYGVTLDFYVSGAKLNSSLLSSLSQNMFTEKLLLSEYGLIGDESEDVKKAAADAFLAYESAKADKAVIEKRLADIEPTLENLEKFNKECQAEYESISKVLSSYLEVNRDALVSPEKVAEYETKLSAAEVKKNEASDKYFEVMVSYNEYVDQLKEKTNHIIAYKQSVADKEAQNLKKLQGTAGINEKAKKISDSIEYEIVGKENESSFIRVEIAVPHDEALAKAIAARIGDALPLYVEDHATVVEGEETNCYQSTAFAEVDEVDKYNKIKFGILGGACAGAFVFAACVFVVILAITIKMSGEADDSSSDATEGNGTDDK